MSDPPLTLAIETSNPGPSGSNGGGVALGRVGFGSGGRVEVLGVEMVRPATRDQDDLIPALERLCFRAGVHPRELARVALSVGPGGFTGLRVAVAAVKMISLVTGARCVAVETSRALARRVPAEARQRRCVVALAWKRDDAWRAVFDLRGPEPRECEPAGLARFDGFLPPGAGALIADPALAAILRERGEIPPGLPVCAPAFDPVAVLEASVDAPDTSPARLEPLYPREPEAVTKWREMKARPDA